MILSCFRLVFFGFALMAVGISLTQGAAAQGAVQGYIQKPTSYRIDYKVDDKKIFLMIVANPAISGCGQITNLALSGNVDFEAMDIAASDYSFMHPLGTGPKDCGSVYKSAYGTVTLDRADLIDKNIKQLRFWYKHTLDTYKLEQKENGEVLLTPPVKPKMFFLGRNLSLTDRTMTRP